MILMLTLMTAKDALATESIRYHLDSVSELLIENKVNDENGFNPSSNALDLTGISDAPSKFNNITRIIATGCKYGDIPFVDGQQYVVFDEDQLTTKGPLSKPLEPRHVVSATINNITQGIVKSDSDIAHEEANYPGAFIKKIDDQTFHYIFWPKKQPVLAECSIKAGGKMECVLGDVRNLRDSHNTWSKVPYSYMDLLPHPTSSKLEISFIVEYSHFEKKKLEVRYEKVDENMVECANAFGLYLSGINTHTREWSYTDLPIRHPIWASSIATSLLASLVLFVIYIFIPWKMQLARQEGHGHRVGRLNRVRGGGDIGDLKHAFPRSLHATAQRFLSESGKIIHQVNAAESLDLVALLDTVKELTIGLMRLDNAELVAFEDKLQRILISAESKIANHKVEAGVEPDETTGSPA